MTSCDTTVLVTCAYSEEEFTPGGESTRTYVVRIKRNEVLRGTDVQLHSIPDNGHCKRTSKHKWSCTSRNEEFNLIASWNRSDATLTIVNDDGVKTHLLRDAPTLLLLESGTRTYKLILAAGTHNRTFEVVIAQVGASNIVVLAEIPVLLDLWWGQGGCAKSENGYTCIAKQDAINIVVHYPHSDKIHAQLQTSDGQLQNIQMGLPADVIMVGRRDVDHLLLKMWTEKEHIEYKVVVKRQVRETADNDKHAAIVQESHPQTVAEEREEAANKKKLRARKKQSSAALDFLSNSFFA